MAKAKILNIPKTIRVGAHTYEVEYPYVFREVDGYLGLHDTFQRRILLADKDFAGNLRAHSDVYKTLIHEIIHAVDAVYLKGRLGEEGDEEKIVDALAEGLLQVLLDCKLLKPLKRSVKP